MYIYHTIECMGTLINLYENKYQYEIPAVPSREEDILGYNLKKKDQYWRTPTFPEPFIWERMSTREQFEIVEKDREHWQNGCWFMNNGEPTYITGMHYDHLTHATFEFGKASYFESQRLDFYFRNYVLEDPDCFGALWLKPRRYGMTLEEITQQTYTAMSNPDSLQGMMSDNRDKTYDTIFNPLVNSYIKRPAWTRPKIYMPNGRIPKSKLIFNDGKVSNDYDTSVTSVSSGCLNSLIQPKSTTVIGYDGWKLIYLTMDEVWKWKDISPFKCWEKQKKCLAVGSRIVGKGSVLSTMGDDDDYADAIEDGITMWHGSDTDDRDANGRTKTGLYQYFISAIDAQFDFADIYGRINRDQAEQWIRNEYAKYPEGSKERMFEERRLPLTKEMALATANSSAVFNTKRLQHFITILEKTPEDQYPTFRADLNELPDGRVELEKNKFGLWEFSHLPVITKEKDYSNRWFKDGNGHIKLYPNPQGVIGYDPVQYDVLDTTSGSISMAAIVAKQKFDYYGNNGANKFQALYHARPDRTQDAHFECFKLSKYLGYPIMYERQTASFKTSMTDYFALELLLRSPVDGQYGMWNDNQRKVIKRGVDLLVTYWVAPKTLSDIDYMELTKFIAMLKQAKVFNPAKTTIYDIIMAILMGEHGMLQIKETNLSDNYLLQQNRILDVIHPKRT